MPTRTAAAVEILPWRKLFAVDVETETQAVPVPVLDTTPDVAAGWIRNNSAPEIDVAFYGTTADTQTATARFWGYRQGWDAGSNFLDLGGLVCELALTLGGKVGAAGGIVTDGHKYVDTIELTHGDANLISVVSPANDLIAGVKIPFFGYEWLRCILSCDDSAATINAIGADF